MALELAREDKLGNLKKVLADFSTLREGDMNQRLAWSEETSRLPRAEVASIIQSWLLFLRTQGTTQRAQTLRALLTIEEELRNPSFNLQLALDAFSLTV